MVLAAGLGLLGNIFAAGTQADIARQRAKEELRRYETEQRERELRRRAYEQTLQRGREMGEAGEAGFYREAERTLPELEQARQDILEESAEGLQLGARQLGAELARGGVRGGQAATHMRRGVGEMALGAQRDITGLEYDEAARRAAERRAYERAKAARGMTAELMPAAF